MKSPNQIFRYTSDCVFPEEDWPKVYQFCRDLYGPRIPKKSVSTPGRPLPLSTFEKFTDWIDNGLGSGDFVRYGNTMGIVGKSTPEGVTLVCYCDYEGNLIVKNMKVKEPNRLELLDEAGIKQLKSLLYNKGVDFYPRSAKILPMYTPQKYFYVSGEDSDTNTPFVGIYLESDGSKVHLLGGIKKRTFYHDFWINTECTPLKPATTQQVRQVHKYAVKAGYYLNERLHEFMKVPKKGSNNVYYYLNESFDIAMDKDTGSKIHNERFEAGNYFADRMEAMNFMREVRRMRGKA